MSDLPRDPWIAKPSKAERIRSGMYCIVPSLYTCSKWGCNHLRWIQIQTEAQGMGQEELWTYMPMGGDPHPPSRKTIPPPGGKFMYYRPPPTPPKADLQIGKIWKKNWALSPPIPPQDDVLGPPPRGWKNQPPPLEKFWDPPP